MLVRRVLAGALLVLAACLAMRPVVVPDSAAAADGTPTVVAAHDLSPGTVLSPEDVDLRSLPKVAVPAGALRETGSVTGRTLAGAARSGEPITDVRLVGPANTRLTTGESGTVAVAVRLADPGVATLLRPGSHVDVIAAGRRTGDAPEGRRPGVVVSDVTVVTVRDAAGDSGASRKLVVLAVPRASAPRVAAASLDGAVAVALR